MSQSLDLSLIVERLGISGLDRAEATRLAVALERNLGARLVELGGLAGLGHAGSIALDHLNIALTERGAPEAMGANIAAQIAGALAPQKTLKSSGRSSGSQKAQSGGVSS